jgi:hypothetical protein
MPTANRADMSNDDLLAQLNELCEEVGARIRDYLSAEDRDELIEGAAFAAAVKRVVQCEAGTSSFGTNTIFWTEKTLADMAVDARLAEPQGLSDFDAFLAEHPELGASPSRQHRKRQRTDEHPVEPRLEFTDEDVLEALVELSSLAVPFAHPNAWHVRGFLRDRQGVEGYGGPLAHSNLMRVVAALKRLEKAGHVVQEVHYVHGQRSGSDWHPARGGDDA